MSSKIIILLTLTTSLLVCPALAMKKIQKKDETEKPIKITLYEKTYELSEETAKKIGHLQNVFELAKENAFEQNDENEEKEDAEKKTDYGLKKLLESTRPGTTEKEFTKQIELTKKITGKEQKQNQTLINNLSNTDFIVQAQLTHMLKNNALKPFLDKHLQSIIEKHAKQYCLHGTGPLKKFLAQLPSDFCNDALYDIPYAYFPPIKTLKGPNCVVKINENLVVSRSYDTRCNYDTRYNNGTMKLWNLTTSKCLTTFEKYKKEEYKKGHKNTVTAIIKINDHQIVSTSLDNTLKLWDLNTGHCLETLIGHQGYITSAVKINDTQIVSTSCDDTLKLWDLNTGHCLKTFIGHKDNVMFLVKINDTQILSRSLDKTLKLWDLNTDQCLKTLVGHKNSVTYVAKINDHQVVSTSDDNTLKLWDLNTGQCLKTLVGHKDSITSIVKINDHQILSSSWDNTLKLWNLDTGQCLKTFDEHQYFTRKHLVKIKDHQILFKNYDTLKILDLNTDQCLKTLVGHKDRITSIVKINDHRIVSTDYNNILKIWDLNCLQKLSFEQKLFLKNLKLLKKLTLTDYEHAYKTFCNLPKFIQKWATTNNLIHLSLMTKIWNFVKDHPKTVVGSGIGLGMLGTLIAPKIFNMLQKVKEKTGKSDS